MVIANAMRNYGYNSREIFQVYGGIALGLFAVPLAAGLEGYNASGSILRGVVQAVLAVQADIFTLPIGFFGGMMAAKNLEMARRHSLPRRLEEVVAPNLE